MTHLKLVLDWFPNTNHTGILLALKRGWFKEAGLDVEMSGQVHGVMELHGADFICGPQISMLDNMMHGVEMTGIAVFNQKCDSGIVSLKKSGITRPRELMGKRLTHWSPEWYHRAIGALVNNDGGDYSKVILVNKDVGDIVTTLRTEADATWVYANWENEELIEAGEEINYFNLADFDKTFDFAAPAMAATRRVLEDHPEEVRTFLKIIDRGFREAAANPEVVLEVKEYMPEGTSDAMLLRSQKHLQPIILDEQGRWGRIKAERWDRMSDWLIEIGWYDKRRDTEWTNDYFED